jgi:hypothetical protein
MSQSTPQLREKLLKSVNRHIAELAEKKEFLKYLNAQLKNLGLSNKAREYHEKTGKSGNAKRKLSYR